MKKPSITLGYLAVFFTALYAVFKYSLLPGANVIMIIAGIILAIYFPVLFLNQISKRHKDRPKPVDKFGALLLSLIIISIVFRFNDWSLMGFKGDQVIRVLTLPSWIYVVPYLCLSLIYVPWLIFTNYRSDTENVSLNIIGGIGLAIIPISLLGMDFHFPFHKSMFQLGNIIIILVYLPLRIRLAKKENKELDYIFQTLIIAYILFIFVYGVFKGLPTTYLQVIESIN